MPYKDPQDHARWQHRNASRLRLQARLRQRRFRLRGGPASARTHLRPHTQTTYPFGYLP